MNIRAYGYQWYDQQNLSNVPYLVPCQLRKLVKNEIVIEVPMFNEDSFTFDYKSFFNYIYLERPQFDHILVTETLCNDLNW
jgi:hypothetical protein